MLAIIEERYNNVTLQNDARQISSIKIGALMNSVHDTFHFTDMTADMAFLSSEILSFRLRKPAERLKLSAFQIVPQKKKRRNHKPTDRVNGVAKKCPHKRLYFWKVR
jgi:hypothetical protein